MEHVGANYLLPTDLQRRVNRLVSSDRIIEEAQTTPDDEEPPDDDVCEMILQIMDPTGSNSRINVATKYSNIIYRRRDCLSEIISPIYYQNGHQSIRADNPNPIGWWNFVDKLEKTV